MKKYKCCICHEVLEDKPIRLVKMIYGAGKYNQYAQVGKYDFCDKCYLKFSNWLLKHKEGR